MKPVVLLFCILAITMMAMSQSKVGDLSKLDVNLGKFFSEDLGVFEHKKKAGLSDWLAVHEELGQTYEQYLKSKPNYPNSKRNALYLLPLGEFDEKSPSLRELQSYMKAYFMPLEVKVLDAIPDEKMTVTSRMNNGNRQWKSTEILRGMVKALPRDAYGMLAVTMTDLYPKEGWNFVFGQASVKMRVGVFSFARYDSEDENLSLVRAAKVITHEMGHMFGIRHCTFYECNLNGANHLAEMDRTPLHLCPVCLRKLHRANGFEPASRYRALLAFYKRHEMKEQVSWLERRLERVELDKMMPESK